MRLCFDTEADKSLPVLGSWAGYGVYIGAAVPDALGIRAEPLLRAFSCSELLTG